jgi:FixJ family two-component response regulator
MTQDANTRPRASAGVSLVDGNAAVRHERQLMLRSENYNVRSYATCAALLADPSSRNYPCIVLDVEMEDVDGFALLAQMRSSGWKGKAILLDGVEPESELAREAHRNGDCIVRRTIGDASLLNAIAASLHTDAAEGQIARSSGTPS